MNSRAEHDRMANAIRVLAMDAVERAGSGHPGLPMGAADVATVLFTRFMKFDPDAPDWPDRDRFVLSAGHGSMLIYAVLHLLGYAAITLDQLRRFRQLGSITAGHPEYGHTPGIETTTGPLGQGLATAVGMAIAEEKLRAEFGADIVDHHTYVLASDGDLMEGISHEAIALAGHQRLARLIVLWDDNAISIDGPLSLSDSTDQLARFCACGWAGERVDGHDPGAIAGAIERARNAQRPSLIACRTIIGFGAPKKAGTAKAHGEPLGAEELAGAKAALGITGDAFSLAPEIVALWRAAGQRGKSARAQWRQRQAGLAEPARGEFDRRLEGAFPAAASEALRAVARDAVAAPQTIATRKSSEIVLEALNPLLPETFGGSADLSPSNNTRTKTLTTFAPGTRMGRYLHYGVREHAMAAAMNGMALHGGLLPYGGTFLVFTDYARPAIRLAALMRLRVIYVMTHDSIGLGEDGPTHQPVEHLAALRAIPGLLVIRPADTVETAQAWEVALRERRRPTLLALTRQALPPVTIDVAGGNRVARGAYVLWGEDDAEVTLFASGSEVHVALEAKDLIIAAGHTARVVGVPCVELFREQGHEYRARVLGTSPVRVAVEAGMRQGWDEFVGADGAFIGMQGFGASAPYKELYRHFGITARGVADAALARLRRG
ncbi:MAG: transketolase [Proteobacteria bacterium]|nr:transketolase [Pseudomonadota bacterium]